MRRLPGSRFTRLSTNALLGALGSAEEPWFPENEAKVAYCALVEQHPEAELDPGVKKQMTAALLKRAMVDIEVE